VHATRLFLAAVLTTLSLLATACGGGGGGGALPGGSTPEGAALVRAAVLAFVSLDTDTGSSQWQALDDLSQKFPDREKLIQQLKQSINEEGLDFDRDVKPALGPELDIVVSRDATVDETAVVGLTKPDDPDKFKALVAKANAGESGDDRAVLREIGDGWYAISDSQGAITRVLAGDSGDKLSDGDQFGEAMDKLPGEALAKLYLDGRELREVLAQQGSTVDPSTAGLDELRYVAASASAEDDGVRVHGATVGLKAGTGNFSSELVPGVPGDALALLDFRGEGTIDQLEKLKSNPQVGQALQQLEAMLGVPFEEVLALLRNEVAFYVRPGAGIPELTLVLQTPNEANALATLDKLAQRLAAAAGTQVQEGTQGGHTVKTINFGQFQVHYGAADGKVLVTSGVNGIAEYGGSGERLPDSADFEEAQAAAEMPDEHGAFFYVNLKDALPLIEGLAGLAGESLPSDVTENLRPLRSFLAWGEGSGDSASFDAFLEIK